MTKIEKILDIDPGRELSEPVHLVSVQKSDVGQGSAVSARWWCVWNIHVCLPISCVTDIRCAAVCRRSSAELLGCDVASNVGRRHILLFRVYVYVVLFPSLYVIPFIRLRCSISVNVRYSVYTSTLFRFRHCTLFRLYVNVNPFPPLYVIPFIRPCL